MVVLVEPKWDECLVSGQLCLFFCSQSGKLERIKKRSQGIKNNPVQTTFDHLFSLGAEIGGEGTGVRVA